MAAAADRHLLFGLLALQTGFVDQGQLVAGFQAWTLNKSISLADHLEARGAIDAADRVVVQSLVTRHLERNAEDIEKSLAAVPAAKSTRESLTRLGDAEIEATLGHVGSALSGTHDGGDDGDRTATYAVGSTTSEGQRFRIVRPHARGGLGVVFVAIDSELDREVALKQILDERALDHASQVRFLIEAQITGGLEHPGIVPVYGLGTDRGGRPYYAMRFIRGDSLKGAIDGFHAGGKSAVGSRDLGLRKLLRHFTDVCNAVGYAHSRGVIHRDIKPANIVLGRFGETIVVDWGLAKALGRLEPGAEAGERMLMPPSGSGSALTLPGSAMGTPAYMSPEQAEGDLDRTGPRSDVYSLGSTLYYLLTGQPPFAGDAVDVIRLVQKGVFPSPRRLDPGIDPALEAICLKAMSLRPEDRYDSCGALANDLDRWTADEPVLAWSEPFGRRARRWARRNRTAVTAAAVTLVAGFIGLTAVLGVQTRANSVLTAKNAELDRANRLKDEANAGLLLANVRQKERFDLAMEAIKLFHGEVGDDLVLKAEQFKPLRDRLLRGAATFYGKLERLLEGQSDPTSRAAMGNAYHELGALTEKIGNQSEALAVHRKALAVRYSLANGPDSSDRAKLDVTRSLIAEGRVARATGDTARALGACDEARRLLDGLTASSRPTDEARELLALSYHQSAMVVSDTGKKAESLETLDKAIAIRRSLVEASPSVNRFQSDLADSYNEVARAQLLTGRKPEALTTFGHALTIRQRLADANPDVLEYQSDLAKAHNNVGATFERCDRLSESLAELAKAVAIRRSLAELNPAVTEFQYDLAFSLYNLSYTHIRLNRTAEALAENGEAAVIFQRLVQSNPTVTNYQLYLARTVADRGQLLGLNDKRAEAVAEFRQAAAIMQRLADANPAIPDFQWYLAQYIVSVAELLSRDGNFSEMRATLEKAMAISTKLAAEHPDIPDYQKEAAIVATELGMLKADQGDQVGGLENCRYALARLTAIKSPDLEEMYLTVRAHAKIGDLLAAGLHNEANEPGDTSSAHLEVAIALLTRAIGEGFRDPVNLPQDKAIKALRSRPDFQLLMLDVAFPEQPFAP
jgi:serine/threonine-protein kinase